MKLDPRDGWLSLLRSKFTDYENRFLEDEFEELEYIVMSLKMKLKSPKFYTVPHDDPYVYWLSKIEIRAIGLPKLSHLVQQEFYRALRTLRTHELQDSNMKAAIEFARDLLCIDEIDFDRWFKGTSYPELYRKYIGSGSTPEVWKTP